MAHIIYNKVTKNSDFYLTGKQKCGDFYKLHHPFKSVSLPAQIIDSRPQTSY